MSVTEFHEWSAYFDWKAKQEKKAMAKAKSKGRR
tara:strand:+ start:1993 stop:2094 length:102 start_codon:yes stop_codon:yes gene_type:complete